MLIFQLKNGRHYHEAVVALLLFLVGIIPENVNAKGGKCYKCFGGTGTDCHKGVKTGMEQVNCLNKFCLLTRSVENDTMRDCISTNGFGECFCHAFGEGECKRPGLDLAIDGPFVKCLGEHSSPDLVGTILSGYRKDEMDCVCEGELCNMASGINPTIYLITIGLAVSFRLHLFS